MSEKVVNIARIVRNFERLKAKMGGEEEEKTENLAIRNLYS